MSFFAFTVNKIKCKTVMDKFYKHKTAIDKVKHKTTIDKVKHKTAIDKVKHKTAIDKGKHKTIDKVKHKAAIEKLSTKRTATNWKPNGLNVDVSNWRDTNRNDYTESISWRSTNDIPFRCCFHSEKVNGIIWYQNMFFPKVKQNN